MNATIKYIGTIGSGNMFKYQVIPVAVLASGTGANAVPASDGIASAIAGLKADGVKLNPNVGTDGLGFLSQTHLYNCAKVGEEVTVNIMGYTDPRDRDINYFKDIDKEKQKAFTEKKKLVLEVQAVVNVERALEDAASGLDVEKFEKIRVLKLQQKMLETQIKNITVAD